MHICDQGAIITPAADVFSLGIVVLETYLGYLPYNRIPFPPELLEERLPRGLPQGPARDQALKDVTMYAVDVGLAMLGSSIPAPGESKVWDCFQTGNPFVDRLVAMCCHPDPQQRASAAEVAAFLDRKMRKSGSNINVAPEPQLRAALPGRQSAETAPRPAQQSGCSKVKRLFRKLLPFSKRRAQQN